MQSIPSDVNWVEAKMRCCPELVFNALKQRLKDDVDQWSRITGRKDIEVNDSGNSLFSVSRRPDDMSGFIKHWCRVENRNDELVGVVGKGAGEEFKFTLRPQLSDQGTCILLIDEKTELTL